MNSRVMTNVFLFVIAIGLAALLFYEPKPTEEVVPTLVPALGSAAITTIKISRPGKADAELSNNEGTWRMTAPVNIRANSFIANKIAALPKFQSYADFAIDPAKLDAYGLLTPQFSVTLNDVHMDFGVKNPVSKRQYVKIDNRIHLINGEVSQILSGSPTSLIAHQLLADNINITKIKLPAVTLSKEKGVWTIEPPQSKAISQDVYNDFIDQWRFSQALYVSLDTDTQNQNPQKSNDSDNPSANIVEIHTHNQQIIRFSVLENADDVRLMRRDDDQGNPAIIEYHMHAGIKTSMLQFPPEFPPDSEEPMQ